MTKKKKIPADDPAQAKRFAETVRALEADGDLNLTEASAGFDKAFKKMVPAKTPPKR